MENNGNDGVRVSESARNEVTELLKKSITPEFLNRIDEIIIFTPLGKSEITEVTRLQLKRVEEMLNSQGFELQISEKAVEWLAQTGFDPIYGARPIKRTIQKYLVNKLSELIISEELTQERPLRVDANQEGLTFSNK
jgi:ATP-dependent Clp protease ATP-binding subunit ClpB